MYIWTGEVEERWNWMEEDEFDTVDGEKTIAAETFDEALDKLKSLYVIGEKVENDEYDKKTDPLKFFVREEVRVVSLERGNQLDA